ncbi:MAG TPA: hypothetical protein VFW29_12505 [Solirubrobacteraceae bacterium]|nr:hypothetical protein [Solirubrobacteraceae bacterium]
MLEPLLERPRVRLALLDRLVEPLPLLLVVFLDADLAVLPERAARVAAARPPFPFELAFDELAPDLPLPPALVFDRCVAVGMTNLPHPPRDVGIRENKSRVQALPVGCRGKRTPVWLARALQPADVSPTGARTCAWNGDRAATVE